MPEAFLHLVNGALIPLGDVADPDDLAMEIFTRGYHSVVRGDLKRQPTQYYPVSQIRKLEFFREKK